MVKGRMKTRWEEEKRQGSSYGERESENLLGKRRSGRGTATEILEIYIGPGVYAGYTWSKGGLDAKVTLKPAMVNTKAGPLAGFST